MLNINDKTHVFDHSYKWDRTIIEVKSRTNAIKLLKGKTYIADFFIYNRSYNHDQRSGWGFSWTADTYSMPENYKTGVDAYVGKKDDVIEGVTNWDINFVNNPYFLLVPTMVIPQNYIYDFEFSDEIKNRVWNKLTKQNYILEKDIAIKSNDVWYIIQNDNITIDGKGYKIKLKDIRSTKRENIFKGLFLNGGEIIL